MLTAEENTQSVSGAQTGSRWVGRVGLIHVAEMPSSTSWRWVFPLEDFLPFSVEVFPLAPLSCYLSHLDNPTSVLGFTFLILQGSVLFLTIWQSPQHSEAGLSSWAVSGRPWIAEEPGGFRASLLQALSSLGLCQFNAPGALP